MKNRTVCFTGKRPQNLPCGFNEKHPICIKIKFELKKAIQQAVREGYTHFISSVALGVDIWAAEAVLELKAEYSHIKLESAVACMSQADSWSYEYKERFVNLLGKCDRVKIISLLYTRECLFQRNRYMVDSSSLLIAVYNDDRGGTGYTVNYARSKGLNIKFLNL